MAIEELYFAHTQGFCAGVVNAIDIVELSIKSLALRSMFDMRLFIIHLLLKILSLEVLYLLKILLMCRTIMSLCLVRMGHRQMFMLLPESEA